MALENKLGITNSAELAREEERISKRKAVELFESSSLDKLAPGRFASLQAIHKALFEDIYDFAGELRTVNLAKGNFRFAPLMYLEAALANIDKMPQSTFDEIVEKYVEMNIAHPFREGNGRSTRLWLDQMLKADIGQVVDWSRVDKEDYLLAMERSPIQETDQVMGYEAGADDYMTKPFSLSVLLLKIEAHFRRRKNEPGTPKIHSKDIVFIPGEMRAFVKEREISLTKNELKMLSFFLQNPKQILSKTQLLENVFDLDGDFMDENTVAVNIRRLREKIEEDPAAPVYIKNIRGLGYIWNQEVSQ